MLKRRFLFRAGLEFICSLIERFDKNGTMKRHRSNCDLQVSYERWPLFATGSQRTSKTSGSRARIKRDVTRMWMCVSASWTFTYLWLESWPSACSAPVWPPCSSAVAWSGSRALSGSSVQQPETYPPNSYPGHRPKSARQLPGPAGAPWRERCGRMRRWMEMRSDRSQRVQSYCGRPWQLGLQSCRGIWPGCSANSPPATTHTPPGDRHRVGWNSGSGQ